MTAEQRGNENRRKEIDNLTWRVVQAVITSVAQAPKGSEFDMQAIWAAVRIEIEKAYP